jgi:hypothetical protein
MNIIHRYKNQRVSQEIHFRNRPKGERQYRVENCHRLKRNRSHQVSLRKKAGATRAHYGDLQTCGSVHACAVCASIISERRCQYVQAAIDSWKNLCCESSVYLFTFTTPHYIFQPLVDVLGVQDQAFRIMRKQPQKRVPYKVWSTIMDEMGVVGSISARETTFGLNGWHPHRHELVMGLTASVDQVSGWRSDLSRAFAIAFEKAGGRITDPVSFHRRAVRIDQIHQDDDGFTRVSHYMTEIQGDTWTLAQETTKGAVKTGKNGNITPFGMLDAIRLGASHSGLYSLKFWEFVQTMHGKKQLWPTPGLNALLGLGDWKSDSEVLKESSAGNHYSFLTDQEWEQINQLDIRGEILTLTENRNEFEFMTELDHLLKSYKKECA